MRAEKNKRSFLREEGFDIKTPADWKGNATKVNRARIKIVQTLKIIACWSLCLVAATAVRGWGDAPGRAPSHSIFPLLIQSFVRQSFVWIFHAVPPNPRRSLSTGLLQHSVADCSGGLEISWDVLALFPWAKLEAVTSCHWLQ